MNTKKILLIGGTTLGVAAILKYIYQNVLLAKQWDYSVDDFSIEQFAPTFKFNAFLTIINKSGFQATVKDIDISVTTSGKVLTKIVKPELQTIVADGNTKISIKVELLPKALLDNFNLIVAELIKKKNIDLDFVGTMKLKTPLGFMTIPVKYSSTGKDLYALYKEYYP